MDSLPSVTTVSKVSQFYYDTHRQFDAARKLKSDEFKRFKRSLDRVQEFLRKLRVLLHTRDTELATESLRNKKGLGFWDSFARVYGDFNVLKNETEIFMDEFNLLEDGGGGGGRWSSFMGKLKGSNVDKKLGNLQGKYEDVYRESSNTIIAMSWEAKFNVKEALERQPLDLPSIQNGAAVESQTMRVPNLRIPAVSPGSEEYWVDEKLRLQNKEELKDILNGINKRKYYLLCLVHEVKKLVQNEDLPTSANAMIPSRVFVNLRKARMLAFVISQSTRASQSEPGFADFVKALNDHIQHFEIVINGRNLQNPSIASLSQLNPSDFIFNLVKIHRALGAYANGVDHSSDDIRTLVQLDIRSDSHDHHVLSDHELKKQIRKVELLEDIDTGQMYFHSFSETIITPPAIVIIPHHKIRPVTVPFDRSKSIFTPAFFDFDDGIATNTPPNVIDIRHDGSNSPIGSCSFLRYEDMLDFQRHLTKHSITRFGTTSQSGVMIRRRAFGMDTSEDFKSPYILQLWVPDSLPQLSAYRIQSRRHNHHHRQPSRTHRNSSISTTTTSGLSRTSSLSPTFTSPFSPVLSDYSSSSGSSTTTETYPSSITSRRSSSFSTMRKQHSTHTVRQRMDAHPAKLVIFNRIKKELLLVHLDENVSIESKACCTADKSRLQPSKITCDRCSDILIKRNEGGGGEPVVVVFPVPAAASVWDIEPGGIGVGHNGSGGYGGYGGGYRMPVDVESWESKGGGKRVKDFKHMWVHMGSIQEKVDFASEVVMRWFEYRQDLEFVNNPGPGV